MSLPHARPATLRFEAPQGPMMCRWLQLASYALGGVFLANAVPHFANGISGREFPSPAGGIGSPTLNVVWGGLNIVFAYVLLARVGRFDLRNATHALSVGVDRLGHGDQPRAPLWRVVRRSLTARAAHSSRGSLSCDPP